MQRIQLIFYGSDSWIYTVASNGGTHTTWEDVALMREVPDAIGL